MYRRDVIDGLRRFPNWARWFGAHVDRTGTIYIQRNARGGLLFTAHLMFTTDDSDIGTDGLSATERAKLAFMDTGVGPLRPRRQGHTGRRWSLNEEDLMLVLPVVAPFLNRLAGPARLALELDERKLLHGLIPRDLDEMAVRMALLEGCRQMGNSADPGPLFRVA